MFRFMTVLIFLWASTGLAVDGIQTGKKFKVPFAVDGKVVPNRALVTTAADGKAVLTIVYVKGTEIEEVRYTLTRQDSPDPDPDPNPDPDPEPIPVEKLWGVVIYESASQTPQQAIVMLSAKVRKLFAGAGEQFRAVDKDTATGEPWKTYIAAAAGKPLPYLFLVDETGRRLFEGNLPATVDATVGLISKYRKGGAQ